MQEQAAGKLLYAAGLAALALTEVAHHIPNDSEDDIICALALQRLHEAIKEANQEEIQAT